MLPREISQVLVRGHGLKMVNPSRKGITTGGKLQLWQKKKSVAAEGDGAQELPSSRIVTCFIGQEVGQYASVRNGKHWRHPLLGSHLAIRSQAVTP